MTNFIYATDQNNQIIFHYLEKLQI